jgi:hypothetical protein
MVCGLRNRYHRIETYDEKQDVDYYLTRLETYATRLNEIACPSCSVNLNVAREIITIAREIRGFTQALKDALSEGRFDVT